MISSSPPIRLRGTWLVCLPKHSRLHPFIVAHGIVPRDAAAPQIALAPVDEVEASVVHIIPSPSRQSIKVARWGVPCDDVCPFVLALAFGHGHADLGRLRPHALGVVADDLAGYDLAELFPVVMLALFDPSPGCGGEIADE